ncbi:MAG TPA: response regulator transcription factor [Steroidobacteraceae bacterium]|jgi:DNA-binding NarL/FixJ family response regulator|nr:response regulator transcription factor [Steroidobacteraceae bacterium]
MEGPRSRNSTPASAPIRTLIADSHGVVVDAMKVLLRSLGDVAVVGCAIDDVTAVDLAVKLRPDVALIALNVPGIDGIAVTRQIRKLSPTTRVLILSHHAGADYVYQALRAGADGYVLKSARAAEVVEALRRISRGRRYMSESVSNLVIFDIAAQRAALDPLSQLTDRERDVLRLTAEGKSSVAAARLLNLSPKTVESYRSRIMRKLEIRGIAALVKFAIRHGIASLDP